MKFKVGDKVRLTREACIGKFIDPRDATYGEVFGNIIESIGEDGNIQIKGSFQGYNESCLELVPEEPEFKYGEEVEVSNNETEWEERIFLAKIPGNPYDPYVCVDMYEEEDFALGKRFEWSSWEYIRKLKPQITRKEIAEKFGISEDFTLVD